MIYALLDESTDHPSGPLASRKSGTLAIRIRFRRVTLRTPRGGILSLTSYLTIIRSGPATMKDLHDRTNRHFSASRFEGRFGTLKRHGLITSEQKEEHRRTRCGRVVGNLTTYARMFLSFRVFKEYLG